jgi:hypothetical protein
LRSRSRHAVIRRINSEIGGDIMTSENLKVFRRMAAVTPEMQADDAVEVARDVMVRRHHLAVTTERNDWLRQWHVVARVDGKLVNASVANTDEDIQEVTDRVLAAIKRCFR